MADQAIPYNKVAAKAPENVADVAANEGISEEEWRARNLPASKIEFRWRYANKTIQLYERRLRSLSAFNVGPAVQAWVRSRLEWVRDNKLYEIPDGVIVLTIDPEGVVDIQLEELRGAPEFTKKTLGEGDAPGTLWVYADGKLYIEGAPRYAADTLARGLVETLGYEVVEGGAATAATAAAAEGAELFAVSDEFGITPLEGQEGPMTQKLIECFDKLWTLDR